MSQLLSPTTTAVSMGAPSRSAALRNISAQALGGSEKQVRVGLGIFDLIAGHDWNPIRIDAERGQIDGCGFHATAGRDRPRNAGLRQPSQQFSGSGQRPDVVCLLPVSGGMGVA